MVLTNYECWANIEGFTNSCDITIQQAQLRSQIDHFNPSVLNTHSVAQSESCFTQWSESNEINAKTVSQISSNGYYGFTSVNKDIAAENANDVNTHFENRESKRRNLLDNNSVNQIKTFSFDITSIPHSKKRFRANGNSTNKLEINAKRCRLETDKILEPPNNMDVDVIEIDKEAKNLYVPTNIHQMLTQPTYPSNIPKNNFEMSASYGLMPGQAQITGRISALQCNKSPEAYCSLYRSENKCTRINERKGTSREIPCYDKNKRHLEQMFSETHGSGLFYLGLDEGSSN